MKKISRQNAEEYWWYRMIKIIYIIVVILCTIFTFYLIRNSEFGRTPKTDFYASSYGFECIKGSTFKGGKFPSSYVNFNTSKSKNQVYSLNNLGAYELRYTNQMSADDVIKKVCINGKVPDNIETLLEQPVPLDSESTYRFIITEEIKDKTWNKVFQQWLILLFFIWIVLKIIPKVFDYIIFGKESKKLINDI